MPAPRRLVYFHYRKDSLTHARKHTHTPKLTGYELQRREREREGETGRERQRDGSKNESFQEPQKHNEPNARAARIVLAPRRRNRSFLISCHGEGKGESSAANSAPCQANTRRGEANEVYKMYVTVARLEHEVCAKLYFYYMPPPPFPVHAHPFHTTMLLLRPSIPHLIMPLFACAFGTKCSRTLAQN